MRFEWKKLLWRREAWILTGILVILWVLSILQFKPRFFTKEFRAELWKYSAREYREVRWEIEKEQAAAQDSGDETKISVLRLASQVIKYYDTFFEKRWQLLADLEEKLKDPPTEYVRKDLQKAYRMYNKNYSFHVVNDWDIGSATGYSGREFYGYLYLFFVLALFCGLFAREKETGMELLLLSSKKGKSKLFLKKTGAAALLLVPVTFFVTVLPFLGLWLKISIPLRRLAEPIQCMSSEFQDSPYTLNVVQLLLVSCLLRLLAGLLALAVAAVCSVFLKRSLFVLLSSAVLCTGMYLAGTVKKPVAFARLLYKMGGFGLLNPYKYFQKYDTVNVLGQPCSCLTLAILFTASFAFFLFVLAYGLYVRPLRKRGKLCS